MIGGNKEAVLQRRSGTTSNAIGEQVPAWADAQTVTGWLDYMSGGAGYQTVNAKIQESTHIFVCDYVPLSPGVEAEKARAVIDGKTYDILAIDNPMELGEQLEIYLKYTGGA